VQSTDRCVFVGLGHVPATFAYAAWGERGVQPCGFEVDNPRFEVDNRVDDTGAERDALGITPGLRAADGVAPGPA
jgi:hypothetical protein